MIDKKLITYTIIGLIAYIIVLTFAVVQKTAKIQEQNQEILRLHDRIIDIQDSLLVNLDAVKDSNSSHIENTK